MSDCWGHTQTEDCSDRFNQPGARGGRGRGAEESRERRQEEEGEEGSGEVWRRRLTNEASGGVAQNQEVGGATAVALQQGEERDAGEMELEELP